MCLKKSRTFLIEAIIAGITGGNKNGTYNFLDQSYLRNLECKGLEVYSVTDIPLSPSGNPVFTIDQLQGSYLTLYTNDPKNKNAQGQWIMLQPVIDLHYIQNSANEPFSRARFEFEPGIGIVWEKSYLTFAAPLNNTDPLSFLINVEFNGVAVFPNQQSAL